MANEKDGATRNGDASAHKNGETGIENLNAVVNGTKPENKADGKRKNSSASSSSGTYCCILGIVLQAIAEDVFIAHVLL